MSRSVLIVGSGGREFALAQQFSEDPTVEQIIVVPGNPAMGTISKCSVCIGNVVELAIRNAVDLAVIGPEQPLVNGLADDLRSVDIPVLGPSKAAAVLEQSKISSKQFMQTMGIPTARAVWYDSPEDAMSGLDEWSTTDGVVVKTDALAGGKGVVLCDSAEDAKSVVHDFMVNPTISVQTERILFEEKLYGVEISAFALCDGRTWRGLGIACDHKSIGEGEQGPNTGGMGAFIPNDFLTDHQKKEIEVIFDAVVQGMTDRGTPYQGILFAGLIVNPQGVRPDMDDQVAVLEFNVRLGDPETQVLLPTLECSIFDLLHAAAIGNLDGYEGPLSRSTYAVHVVAAAQGYPSIDGAPILKGSSIAVTDMPPQTSVIYAGVTNRDGRWVSNGGRVLGVTGIGNSLEEARRRAYDGMACVHFTGMQVRSDIASSKRVQC
jgi:phosphoribosylamine--glycine ligase